MTKSTNTFLSRGTSISFAAFLLAAVINLYTMPTQVALCMAGDYCEAFRVGTYYWNLSSFYGLIVFGISFAVFAVFYLRTGQRLRYVVPAVITPRDVRGKIIFLVFLLLVGAGFVFTSSETECKPGFHKAFGIDSQFCKSNN